jgi:hypothetical protein
VYLYIYLFLYFIIVHIRICILTYKYIQSIKWIIFLLFRHFDN